LTSLHTKTGTECPSFHFEVTIFKLPKFSSLQLQVHDHRCKHRSLIGVCDPTAFLCRFLVFYTVFRKGSYIHAKKTVFPRPSKFRMSILYKFQNSYEANQRLSHWLISLVWYDGHVKHNPQRRQRQLTVFQIVLSCWVLAITASLWEISRMFRRKRQTVCLFLFYK